MVGVSIPSRGFWFFEVIGKRGMVEVLRSLSGFNPLAGILVF